jgi:Papain family cysteine protease
MVQNMRFLSILCLFVSANSLFAQRSSGLIVSPERYQEVPLLPAYSGVKYTEIPVKVNLKKFCPVPGDQGKSGSCVGWAVGYGALTIHRAIAESLSDQAKITQMANSAAFLYNQVRRNKTDCSEGVYLEDGLALVKSQGDCLEQSFSFDQVGCTQQPADQHFNEAKAYRIQDYAAVFALDEDAKSKISKTCKILATQTPLIVGMGVTESFFEVLPGAERWDPDPTEQVSSYHAMVVVGYNSVEKYFDLLNSFGTSWGQNGFIRIPFDDFERLCRFAYVMVPPTASNANTVNNNTPINPQVKSDSVLSGEFVFRQPAGFVTNDNGDELMYFEEVNTAIDPQTPGWYRTRQQNFKVGDVFQLVAREIPRGRYVYVFSQSPDGALNVHFPRSKTAVASAAFVLEKTVEIVIPSEESLLQLPLTGEDHLCILYSLAPIADIDKRLGVLQQDQRLFHEKLSAAFGDVLIGSPDIQFEADKMSFSAITSPEKGKIAAAMILTVKAE